MRVVLFGWISTSTVRRAAAWPFMLMVPSHFTRGPLDGTRTMSMGTLPVKLAAFTVTAWVEGWPKGRVMVTGPLVSGMLVPAAWMTLRPRQVAVQRDPVRSGRGRANYEPSGIARRGRLPPCVRGLPRDEQRDERDEQRPWIRLIRTS
jgi:hypothetical protein